MCSQGEDLVKTAYKYHYWVSYISQEGLAGKIMAYTPEGCTILVGGTKLFVPSKEWDKLVLACSPERGIFILPPGVTG